MNATRFPLRGTWKERLDDALLSADTMSEEQFLMVCAELWNAPALPEPSEKRVACAMGKGAAQLRADVSMVWPRGEELLSCSGVVDTKGTRTRGFFLCPAGKQHHE